MVLFFTNDNRYSREKLKGDIESLESFYKNRGYVEFRLESSQVSVSPDKSGVLLHLIFPKEQLMMLMKSR